LKEFDEEPVSFEVKNDLFSENHESYESRTSQNESPVDPHESKFLNELSGSPDFTTSEKPLKSLNDMVKYNSPVNELKNSDQIPSPGDDQPISEDSYDKYDDQSNASPKLYETSVKLDDSYRKLDESSSSLCITKKKRSNKYCGRKKTLALHQNQLRR